MQEHRHELVVDATPQELWQLFWYRGPRPKQSGDVTIEILHPGDETGEGLVRHCTFRVPRYLMSGGKAHSWEWLTQVQEPTSWKYEAVGKPLWSHAEGWTEFEDLGDGRTRIRFRETYHAFNPILRLLLEKRVHRYISQRNEQTMAASIDKGLQMMRRTRDKQESAHQVDARGR